MNKALEIKTCQALQEDMIFIIGFARSSTSIVAQILNSNKQLYILNEANFYSNHSKNFVESYNDMHFTFENQINKSHYVPDFFANENNCWLDWLTQAKKYYKYLGDKLAFTAYHFNILSPEKIMKFYESRFYGSKYIFTIRNPIQTIISLKKLNGNILLKEEILAWLKYIQLWIEWKRIFPNTLTILTDNLLDEHIKGEEIRNIENFLGIYNFTNYIRSKSTTRHEISNDLTIINEYIDMLNSIYFSIKDVYMQSQEKIQCQDTNRISLQNNHENNKNNQGLIDSNDWDATYRLWYFCEKLAKQINSQ